MITQSTEPMDNAERLRAWQYARGPELRDIELQSTSLTQREILDMAIGVFQMQVNESGTGKVL